MYWAIQAYVVVPAVEENISHRVRAQDVLLIRIVEKNSRCFVFFCMPALLHAYGPICALRKVVEDATFGGTCGTV